MLGGGDQLARGGKSAQFGTGGKSITQEQWDKMFSNSPGGKAKKKAKKPKKSKKCPPTK